MYSSSTISSTTWFYLGWRLPSKTILSLIIRGSAAPVMSISDSSPELHSWIKRCSETFGWAPYRYGFCCVKSLTKLRRFDYSTLSKWRPVAWVFGNRMQTSWRGWRILPVLCLSRLTLAGLGVVLAIISELRVRVKLLNV